MMRLDKYLADMKAGTRSEVKKIIRKGLVTVNGNTVRDSAFRVNETDIVVYDGETIRYVTYEYYVLNKPQGYVCANEDRHYPTVFELIDSRRKDLFTVGRLDADTEGLLLVSNDGVLAHELLSPKKHVEKTYYAETDLPVPEEAVSLFEKGIDLGDFVTKPAKLVILDEHSCHITVTEGKFHQVRRMFEAVGTPVTYLKRISFGPLTLDDLPLGEYRELTEEEVRSLRER